MKVILTGSTGFVGRHIRQALNVQKHEVLILSRTEQEAHQNEIMLKADLNDFESYAQNVKSFQPDACIHLAWEGLPDYSLYMCQQNVLSATTFTDYVLNETSCRKFLTAGSCWEYGNNHGVCIESDEAKILSDFAWAKHAVCSHGKHLADKLDKEFGWFRIFFVYGKGQREQSLIPTLIRSMSNGQCPMIRTPDASCDFVHINDVVNVFNSALSRSFSSGIYNVGCGGSTKVLDVIRVVEDLLEVPGEFSNQLRNIKNEKPSNFWADISKTREQFYWEPRVLLKDGIAELLEVEAAA